MTNSAAQDWGGKTAIPYQSNQQVQMVTNGFTTQIIWREYHDSGRVFKAEYDMLTRKLGEDVQLPNFLTNDNPSVVGFGKNKLLVACTGQESHHLYYLIYDPANKKEPWTIAHKLLDLVNGAPCLAFSGSSIHAVVRNQSNQILVGFFDIITEKWSEFTTVSFNDEVIASQSPPSIIGLFENLLLIVYTNTQHTIQYAIYDISAPASKAVKSRGAASNTAGQFSTDSVVALAPTSPQQTMVAWRGPGTNEQVYYAFMQYDTQTGQCIWTDQYAIEGQTSKVPVSLISLGITYYLSGVDDKMNMYLMSCYFKQWYHPKLKPSPPVPPKPGRKINLPLVWSNAKDVGGLSANHNKIALTEDGTHIYMVCHTLPTELSAFRFDPLTDTWISLGAVGESTKRAAIEVTPNGSLVVFYNDDTASTDPGCKYVVFAVNAESEGQRLTILNQGHLINPNGLIGSGCCCYRTNEYYNVLWLFKDSVCLMQKLPISCPDKNHPWYDELVLPQTGSGQLFVSQHDSFDGTAMPDQGELLVGSMGKNKYNDPLQVAYRKSNKPPYQFTLHFPFIVFQYAAHVEPLGNTGKAIIFTGGPGEPNGSLGFAVCDPLTEQIDSWSSLPFHCPGAPTAIAFGTKFYLFWYTTSGQIRFSIADMYS